MDLKTYLAESRGRTSALAAKLDGVSPAYLYQMATGRRPISVERALAIVHHTDGAVQLWSLRPDDWHLIRPNLIGTKGAPRVAAKAA